MPAQTLAIFAVLGMLAPELAHASRPASRGGFSVQIEDQHGNRLPTYRHRGATYVLGNFDHRYNVRVKNHTGRRIEAVVTVDGRDAISGALGDYARQRGYIVPPHGNVLVEGFRQSHSAVAAFRFTTPGDSYTGRLGTAQHTGVVGVAVFRERARRRVAVARKPKAKKRDYYFSPGGDGFTAGGAEREASPTPAPPRSSASAGARAKRGYGSLDNLADADAPRTRQNLGTRYGESRHSPVVEVPFKRARSRHPDQVLAVYYDDATGLANRGINVYPHYVGNPNPFPQQFAPPPPRY